jgi:O-antigen/teichoic acid export membrane protein
MEFIAIQHAQTYREEYLANLDWVQWPAMLVTVLAAWLIGSQRPGKRMAGFVCFSLSNVLWTIWGFYAEAYALIVLQICLFLMNLRGLKKNFDGQHN